MGDNTVVNDTRSFRDGDVEEPLLDVPVEIAEDETPNFWPCTFNLTKVILGAGIMAIPHGISLVGSVLGLLMLLAVAGLTWFTIYALISGSDRVGAPTYASLVRRTCGAAAEKTLLFIVILGCFGFEVVYLDIIGDVLVGEAPAYTGGIFSRLIEWLVPPPAGVPGARWWFEGRPEVLGAVLLLVLLPLCLQRSMTKLDGLNKVGLVSLALFACSTVWLAGAALARGKAYPLSLLPDWPRLGPTTSARISTMVSVAPVILTAMTCHQSVHPLRQILRPYSGATFNRVVFWSVAMVTVLFIAVSAAACIAFGPAVKEDFLANLDADLMRPLIGPVAAPLVAYTVRLGYVVSLLVSATLIMFPLRGSLLELLGVLPPPASDSQEVHKDEAAESHGEHGAGHDHDHDPSEPHAVTDLAQRRRSYERAFTISTIAALVSIYSTAVLFPNIWTVISLVGSVSCTTMCFILPAAVLLVTQPAAGDVSAADGAKKCSKLRIYVVRALAWFVGALGVALLVNGVAGPFLFSGN